MKCNPIHLAMAFLASTLTSAVCAADQASDYPTTERVEFVLDCMRTHPGPRQEMLYKCSCTLDELAKQFTHDQFVEGSTAANAMSIGGERGAVLRDSESAKTLVSTFRNKLNKAKKDCFIN